MALTEAENEEIQTMIETINDEIRAKQAEQEDLRNIAINLESIYERTELVKDPNDPRKRIPQKQKVIDKATGAEISESRRDEVFLALKTQFTNRV